MEKQNNEIEAVSIPFVAHESSMRRMEEANKRLTVIIMALIIGIFLYFIVSMIIPEEIGSNEQEAKADNQSKITQKIED